MNPQDDLSDELIRDAINALDPPLSNCCDARFLAEHDLCSHCCEHSFGQIEGFKFSPSDRLSFNITFNPITRELISFHRED